jgi:aryl-alcohol dehydrogenase-like predicted oxidoreductase
MFVTVENQPPPWQPSNSALSGGNRHNFAVSQGLDIANWRPAKESPVLAIELARAFVADFERRTCRIQVTREHALPRGMQAKLLLKLQRTHRRKGAKMLVQRRSTHACDRCQVLYTPIPGTRSVDHLHENLRAIDVQLTPADLREIETALSKIEVHGRRMNEERMKVVDQTV